MDFEGNRMTLQNSAYLWRSEILGGIELLRAHYTSFQFRPHAHEKYMVAVTHEGLGQPHFFGEEQSVHPGSIIVLDPGVVHRGGAAPGRSWGYRVFYVDVDRMSRIARRLTGRVNVQPKFRSGVVHDEGLASQLFEAHLALNGSKDPLVGEGFLREALAVLIARHGRIEGRAELGEERLSVTRAKRYLASSLDRNVSMAELSEISGLSASHLSRVFRRDVGIPPHAYQIQLRARRAKELLGKGTPIAEVAVNVGFYDQAHLTRHFKRIFGVTPGTYDAEDLDASGG